MSASSLAKAGAGAGAGAGGLTITNPLILYRALLATKRMTPDPAQHRLAIHLQKLYDRLKDYEPTITYSDRLQQISKAIGPTSPNSTHVPEPPAASRGLWQSLIAQKEKRDSLALTRSLTSHEAALSLDSPRGLMLHGGVGTGKSMLIDLFADCLPNRKKARWHFNTFMLEVLSKLETLRTQRLLSAPSNSEVDLNDYSMLLLARDFIQKSPILFLDEFQLPDRAASKIVTNLMTCFFQLGGVLVATSNRMPEELHQAAGMTFAPPPSRMESLTWRLGMSRRGSGASTGNMFAGQNEFASFLEVLRARCEVWEMDSGKDYRRAESESQAPKDAVAQATQEPWQLDGHQDLQSVAGLHADGTVSASTAANIRAELEKFRKQQEDELTTAREARETAPPRAPAHYLIKPTPLSSSHEHEAFNTHFEHLSSSLSLPTTWQPSTLIVYGRSVPIPRANNGTAHFSFSQLCGSVLGPADYISIASAYHTLILTDVPVLTSLMKNEARRFITLLDAVYEARCKLLITAAAGPDEIFFPDTKGKNRDGKEGGNNDDDNVYAETFSEAYQDVTAPFRPNISSTTNEYIEDAEPDYTHARFEGLLAPDSLEDDPPNRFRRQAETDPSARDDETRLAGLGSGVLASLRTGSGFGSDARSRSRSAAATASSQNHKRRAASPDFGRTSAFTGEDERFAYKRARSRLWEMCGRRWWARTDADADAEDAAHWHKPLPSHIRHWERPATAPGFAARLDNSAEAALLREGSTGERGIDRVADAPLFRHARGEPTTQRFELEQVRASPFRAPASAPAPKFSWTHFWGTMRWGRKAGAWGQGVEGLEARKVERSGGGCAMQGQKEEAMDREKARRLEEGMRRDKGRKRAPWEV